MRKSDALWRALCRYRWLLLVAGSLLVMDQVSKLVILRTLEQGAYSIPEASSFSEEAFDEAHLTTNGLRWAPIEVIEGFLYIVHVTNRGAAWGMLQGGSRLLALTGVLALAGIFHYRKALQLSLPVNQVVFGLFISGVIGNMIDRICYGHVIDFIDVHLPFYSLLTFEIAIYRYPAFNVADCGIVTGVALYMILQYLPKKASFEPSSPPPVQTDSTAP